MTKRPTPKMNPDEIPRFDKNGSPFVKVPEDATVRVLDQEPRYLHTLKDPDRGCVFCDHGLPFVASQVKSTLGERIIAETIEGIKMGRYKIDKPILLPELTMYDIEKMQEYLKKCGFDVEFKIEDEKDNNKS